LLKTKLIIPIAVTLSVLPDIDLLFPFIQHRGPTHSIISALVVFAPFFVAYRKQAVPYFVALVQHSLVGDYIAGGRVQLLWPLTRMYFGTSLDIRSPTNVALEWIMFLTAMIVMLGLKDAKALFQAHKSNLVLAIPTLTVLLPTMLSFPMQVPTLLIPPHVIYTIMFTAAILIEVPATLKAMKNRLAKAEGRPPRQVAQASCPEPTTTTKSDFP
jgi:membrane-bound metal-dependent hydrolase YbcI (DUF457 family)